jgi:hypothetical protein
LNHRQRALRSWIGVASHAEMRRHAVLRVDAAVLARPAERVEGLLRLGRIKRRAEFLGYRVVVARDASRQRAERNGPIAAESGLQHRRSVDRIADRLAKLSVAEWRSDAIPSRLKGNYGCRA